MWKRIKAKKRLKLFSFTVGWFFKIKWNKKSFS